MSEGLIPLNLWGYVGVTLALTHITIVSVTIFLHRHQAHRALDLHPAAAHFFRFWLWLTTGMQTKQWVAVHRKHHAKVESEDDPHSPQIVGLTRVLFGGAWLYHREASSRETLRRYGHGTPNDWLERWLYKPHPSAGLVVLLLVELLLFGWVGLLIWGVQMVWIPFWAAGVINGVGHYFGYRNYECADASTNIVPWAVVIGGEELHNNHHAYPSSAKLSARWWELDMGWVYIRILESLRLAFVKKVAPMPVVLASKRVMDGETVRAVVLSRLQVMADYARAVVLPVLEEEKAKANSSCRRVFRQARTLLIREESRMDEMTRGKLQNILNLSQRLATVYQYRHRLQEIWERTAATQDELLTALQDWCRRAEGTGIRALEEFSRTLRQYSLPAA
jgi:stearoyl-CoA desaturase (delta-9 desaturase)